MGHPKYPPGLNKVTELISFKVHDAFCLFTKKLVNNRNIYPKMHFFQSFQKLKAESRLCVCLNSWCRITNEIGQEKRAPINSNCIKFRRYKPFYGSSFLKFFSVNNDFLQHHINWLWTSLGSIHLLILSYGN